MSSSVEREGKGKINRALTLATSMRNTLGSFQIEGWKKRNSPRTIPGRGSPALVTPSPSKRGRAQEPACASPQRENLAPPAQTVAHLRNEKNALALALPSFCLYPYQLTVQSKYLLRHGTCVRWKVASMYPLNRTNGSELSCNCCVSLTGSPSGSTGCSC
jgi:hypothetical protein